MNAEGSDTDEESAEEAPAGFFASSKPSFFSGDVTALGGFDGEDDSTPGTIHSKGRGKATTTNTRNE